MGPSIPRDPSEQAGRWFRGRPRACGDREDRARGARHAPVTHQVFGNGVGIVALLRRERPIDRPSPARSIWRWGTARQEKIRLATIRAGRRASDAEGCWSFADRSERPTQMGNSVVPCKLYWQGPVPANKFIHTYTIRGNAILATHLIRLKRRKHPNLPIPSVPFWQLRRPVRSLTLFTRPMRTGKGRLPGNLRKPRVQHIAAGQHIHLDS